jgi:superfamily I DNA and/or RNA helicase
VNVELGELYNLKRGGFKANSEYLTAAQQVLAMLLKADVTFSFIGLLSFYRAQLQVHQALTSPLVNVMTVDACQGREFEYVVLDTVISDDQGFSLGFLTDSRKINVALSRAKHGLILVGSDKMAQVRYSNAGARVWSRLIEYHRERGGVVNLRVDSSQIREKFAISGDQYRSARLS